MKILIIYPTPYEAGAFFKKYAGHKPAVGDLAELRTENAKIFAFVSGYGCKAAVQRVQEIKEKLNPHFAFLCGFCGSCSEKIGKCDYLYETQSQFLKDVFENMGAAAAKIACSPKFAGHAEKCEYFKNGYDGVDMEGALFLPIFGAEHFGAFRCVSDELNSEVPEEFFHLLIDLKTGGDKPLLPALLKLLFKRPSDFLKLISFAKNSKKMKKDYDAKALALVDRLSEIALSKTASKNI